MSSALAFGLGDRSVAHVLADGGGLGVSLDGAGQQRVLVVAESDGEHLSSGVTGGGATGSGAHGHEVTVAQSSDLLQYEKSNFRIAQTDFVQYDKSMTPAEHLSELANMHAHFGNFTMANAYAASALDLLIAEQRRNHYIIDIPVTADELARFEQIRSEMLSADRTTHDAEMWAACSIGISGQFAAADRRRRVAYLINEEGFTPSEAAMIVDAS